ncbi:MAG: hypothetical protein ACP5PB_06110 [Acidimicrobiales bacterium]
MRLPVSSAVTPARGRTIELHRWLSGAMILGVLVMIPWTIYLSLSLPGRFHAENWNVAWVGFDGALIVVLAATAWAAWFRRQILAAASIVAATLLLCDAWFDVNTSFGTRDQLVPLLTALAANVPLAIIFILLARHIMLQTAAVLATALDTGSVPHHAHDVPMPFEFTIPSLGVEDSPHASPDTVEDPPDQP